MAERPLYTLYKNLKAQNYDVPDDYNKFESALTRDGKGGADNRHAIYENLKAQNFDVPNTYERFYSALFEPRSKTSSRAKGGSVPMSAADRARFSAGAAAISASAQHTMNNAGRYNRLKQRKQKQQKDFGRVNLGTHQTPYGGDANNVVKDDFAYNPETGKAGAYVSSDNENVYSQPEAEQKQDVLDQQNNAYQEAVDTGEIPSVFDVRDKNGNYDLQENINKNGTYLTEEGARNQFDKKLADAYARKKEIEALIAEDHRQHGNPLLSYGASIGASNGRTAEQSDYSNKLATSLALVKQQIGALEAVKQYPTSSWSEDALKALDNTAFTAKTWDFGLTDFATMGQMERIKTKMDNNLPLSGSDKMLLKSKLGADAAAALEDEKMGNIYRWTKIAGQSLPFMADFFLTGGYGGITKAISRGALKFAAKRGMGKVSAAILKNTGIVAGDVIGSYAMAGSEQAMKTGADIMQRHLGSLYQDEKGDYKFGTFDENGNLLHEGGESMGTALYKGLTSAMVENYTEKLFGHSYGIKKGAINFMEKHGMNASAEFFKNIGKSGWYTNSKKWMEKFGINGFGEEVMEEEIGIPLHALLDGDNKFSDLLDTKQQLDIIGGMALSVGSMYAMGAGSRPVKGVYNRAQYYRFRNKVNVADSDAQNLMGDKWADIKDKIDNTTNEQMGGVLADILRQRDTMSKEQINAAINYGINLMKMRGYNVAKTAEMNAREITNEPTTPEEQHQEDIDNAYSEGHDADDADKHDIQLEHEDQMKTLAAALNISEQQLSAMNDDELQSLTGQNDKLDQAIYDYQLSSARYQGVTDDAQDKIDMAANQAAQRVDMYTDKSRGSVRNATVKASGGAEDYGVYIISGNIATNEDGSINVADSDDMILFYDPTTNSVEHADALRFAELGDEVPADDVKAQAVADAKEKAIKEVAGIVDGTIDVGSQFKVTGADGLEHTYEILADYGDGTAAISIDGNVVENPYSLEDLQQLKDLEDQKRLEAAKAEREQMEKERAEQTQETELPEETKPSLDFNQILNDNGNVVLVDVLDKDGNTKYPDSKLFLIRDTGAKAKVVEMKSDGTFVPHAVSKKNVATISSMSLDEYKQAMAETSMIEENSGAIEGDRGGIEVNDELPPVPDNVTINGDGTYFVDGAVQGGENATAPAEQTEQTPAMTLEDGTIVPMLEDGNPDFSKLTADQTAELYDSQFGEDADSVISGWVSDAKKALDKANNMTVKGKNFVEQKAAKEAKEKAIADAQAAYDSAIAIRDAYNERQLAKVEDTAEGRKELIEKARRKFARLKSAAKDDAEAVSQLYKDVVGSLLHRLYDGTGIDVTDTIPLTAEEYVASNLGAHSLNYEGTETSKGVKQETGLSREDFAKTQLLAADGKGTTIDDLVHSLWENRPSNLESLDTQDIRNALIGVLTSGFKASEARNYIENLRIAQAENILEEQKKAADNAAFAEENKAESEQQTETAPESEEKTEVDSSDEINDEENEQTNAPELSNEQQKAMEEGEKLGFPAFDKEGEPINEYVVELAKWAKKQGLGIDPTSKLNSYADLFLMCKDGFGVITLVSDEGENINQVVYFPDNVKGFDQLWKLQEEFNAGRDLKHSSNIDSELTEGAIFYDGDTAREFKEFVDKKVEKQNKVFGEQRPEEDLPFSAKENGKQQTTAERAADVEKNNVDDMKVVDNIVGEKTRKAFERLAKMMGAKIQWQYSDKLGNGWIQETKDADGNIHRTIFITLDSSITEGAQFIFGHEMTHQIKSLNPAAYNELTQLVLDTYGSDAFDKAIDETMKRYSDAGFSGRARDYYAEEVVADAIGEMIRDLNLAHTLAMKMSHPLLAAIHEILQKIKLAFFGTEYSDVTKNIIRSIEQAYVKTANGQVTNSETGEDVSFSLRLKSAIEETETNPSDAQKESGNYKKGHIKFGGYDYTIENPKGSTRSGKDADGKEWKVTMHDTYGYIRGKFGKDGDHLDMFINDKADLDNWNGDVFVVDQVNPDGSFDEHKVMYGYDSMNDAKKAYLANYSDGWQGLGNITGASKDEFDKWLDTSNRKLKPFADYATVKFSLKDEKIKSIAEKFGVNEDDVAMYANAVERGSTAEAARARANIKRYLLQANEDKISSFKDIIKYTKPINEALKENFGDLDAMIEERRKQVEAQRNAMEAARKRAQEEEEKRQKHLDELSLIPTDELDKRYMDAIANNDESTAREMLDESARRNGYGDVDSDYQGQGAWAAPSNPQYESDEARRADIENSPDVNLEDIALGYNLQPDDYFDNPRAYMNNTAYGLESAHVIKNALDAIKNGEKDVKVKVYRAVPTSVKEGKLRNGDWVTPSKKYAEMHGDNRLDGKYRIIEDEVPANQLWWDGNDVNEFGFDDGKEYRYKNAKNNRKLNDLITYDNKGNVIPPSKRFNSRKSDIRFSLRDMADGKESGAADMAEDLKSLNTPDEVDDAIKTAIDDMPIGWQMANKKMIHIAQALGENRKAEIAGEEPKFSLKDGTLIKAGTYFSGGGLVEEGLKGIIDPVVAVEYDEKISGVYRNNFGQHIVTADVRDVDPKELVKQIDGEVEYFHASPVCKNYSQAKSNHAEVELDKETAASTAKFINAVKPKVVTIENVKGYKDSEAMKIITDALDANGYTWDADVYNAADYGGYTNRERLIVRAVRDGKLPEKPKKMAHKSGWYEAVEDIIPTMTEKKNGVAPWMDVRLKADGIDWRNIDKPLYVMGSAYADGKIPHAFADELLPTLRTKSGDVIVMPDGKVYRAMGRVLARVSGVSDDYKMPFSENLSHTIIGNGIPTQLTEHVIAPLLTGSDPKFSIRTYHGTGASFDKFDLSHALEGEGSESFGHGVYVTNSSKIGREYAQRAKNRKMEDLYKNMRYPDGVKGDVFKRRVFGEMVNDVATGGSVASAKEFAKKRIGADANDIQRTLENLKDREKGTEYEQNLKNRLAEYKEGLKWIDSLDEEYLTQGNANRYDVEIPDDNGSNYLDWEGTIPDSLDKQKVAEDAYKVVSDNQGFNDFKATPLNDFIAHTLKTYVNTTDVAGRVEKLKSDIKDVIENYVADDDVLALNEYLKDATPDDVLATIWYNDLVRDIKDADLGEELYRKLSTYVGDNAASQILSDNGLVGIKYPAGMIHGGAKEGDYNYVIFDENNANIVGNTRFSLRYDQFEHNLNQWKKDNNLPKDAQRPTIPQRNAGESAVDFLRRVDEYRKQMALWKTAPTYEQHLLSDDTALGEFNRELQRGSVLKRIAFQDSMLAIRKAQEAIMNEVGVDRLNMAEDAYTAENRSHGKGKNEFEEYNNEFLQPLRKAYHQMKKVLGNSYDNVRVYMMAKHGLERDAQMAFKKSLEADYEDVNQRSAAYKAYKNDLDRVSNDADLEFGRVDFTTWRQKDNALRGKYSPSYMDYRYDDNGIAYDYSGLSSLFDGSDFEEAAHKLVRDVETKHLAEVQALWNATNAATKKILRDGFKAGMMSKDTYEYVKGMYSHYIPLRGWDGTTADQVWDYIGGGKGAFNQTLKTAHGRTSIADDPIAYIENMAESGILLNNKNWVKQHLMLLAQNHPTSLLTLSKAWYVKSTDANGNEEWIPATPQITSQMNSNQVKAAIDAFEQKMEQMAQTGDATQQRDGLNIAYPQTHSEEREHEVRVMKDGEEYVIYVNGDPQLAQAMNNTRAHRVREIQSGKLDRAAAWLGRKMAAAYTSLSPLFIPSNYFRDLTMTLASTAIREDGRYNYLLRKNLATSWNLGFMLRDYQNGKLREKVSNGNATTKEQMFYDFMMNGGETGFVSSLDLEDLKKKFKNDLKDLDRWKANPVKVGHTIMDCIEFLNRMIEDSNRFAVYMTSIQYGRSIDEAVNDAKDVTLNFNRKGTGEYGWQMIRNLYLFINPAVQSLQTLGALTKHHPFKFTAVTAAWLASGVLVPIVNAALMSLLGGDDDKDKYWQFSKWDRRNNAIMWFPFINEYVKIPLAQEFRAFYGIGDMIASKMMGGELAEETWSQYAEDLLGQVVDMLPLDPTGYDGNIAVSLMPNPIRPVFELAFNVDFTGKPLFKDTEYNKYDPNFTKAYVGTPDWLVRVSKMVNSIGNDYPDVQQNAIDALGDPRYNLNNPAVVDHVLSSYLGGAYTMGSQVLGLLTKSLNDPKEIKMADIPLVSKFVSNPDDRPVTKKQGDEFWNMKENHDRAANTLSKLKKQAKVDGDYSMLERFYGSEEYKQYKQEDVKVKKYEEDKKKERAEESGEEYRPHKLNAEDIYKAHATPKDDFEDLKLKQLYTKLNGFKTSYDLLVDTAPGQSDGYYNTNKVAIDAIDEISLDKQEISELKKGFLEDGKDAYNAEDMKRIRELRKRILSVLEPANKVVVANQKAKAEKK